MNQKYLVITIFKLHPLITSLLQRNSVYSVVSFTISLLSYQILVGTWWHCLGFFAIVLSLSCLLLFLSLPPFTETTTRWQKTTFFTLSPAPQSASSLVEVGALEGSGWCTIKKRCKTQCPLVSLQDKKPGDCWWQSKSSHSLGLLPL